MLDTPPEPPLQLGSEIRNSPTIHNMGVVLKVEGDILDFLCEEDDCFAERMSIACLIEDIRISIGHVSNNNVSLGNLIADALQNALMKDLLVNPLTVGTCICA